MALSYMALAFVSSWFLIGWLRRYFIACGIMIDHPNDRSAHNIPRPRGGGLAFVVVFFVLGGWRYYQQNIPADVAIAFIGGGTAVALIGFFDDRSYIPALGRLLVHFAAAIWVLFWLGGLPPLVVGNESYVLPFWGAAVGGAFFLAWLVNLYNFMDGIDGIAAGETITVALGAAAILFFLGEREMSLLLQVLAGAMLGFLYWNWPPAKVFMGDGGSGFLGLVLGVFTLWSWRTGPELFWAWIVLLGVFVVDATVTLLRRIFRGDKFYQSHNDHAYQHAAWRYNSHGLVTLAVVAINLGWLLPLAVLVALGRLGGLSAVLIAYAPLVWLAFYFKAGLKIEKKFSAFALWPSFSEKEIEAVAEVLRSGRVNYWTGEETRNFEQEFAAWVGVKHAVALSNGTVALEAALRAVGVGPGDEVVVTPRSFIASASAVVVVGGRAVFAEVDPDSQNITAETIRPLLTSRTKAIVCVHLAGWPCDMDPIMELAAQHGLSVIEDCAQAHGATYKGRAVGSIGHVGAWSFCQDKIITTGGEGGMVTTNTREIWQRIWSYKDHGKAWDAVYRSKEVEGLPAGHSFRWVHGAIGTNGRMIEMQAVLGRIQLGWMGEWHRRRKANAEKLAATFSVCPALRVPLPPPGFEHAWYKFYAFVRPEALKPEWSRERIMIEINQRGVPCFSGTCPEIYREKAFTSLSAAPPAVPLPVAHELGETSLMFLVHPTLTDAEINLTCKVVQQVMTDATF